MSVLKYKKNGHTYTLNTPSGSGGGSGHIILDTDDTEMTTRSNLKFGGDFEVSDDSENDITEVIPYELTSADLAEIITNPPSSSNQSSGSGSSSSGSNTGITVNSTVTYSTTEQQVGAWIDDSPLYQKTLTGTTINSTEGTISTGLTGIGYIELVDFQVSNGSYRKNLLDSVSIKEDGTDIYMVADSDSLFKNKTFYATVLYTKSSGSSGE